MAFISVTETTKARGATGTLTETNYRRSWTILTDGTEFEDDVYAYMADPPYNIFPGAAHPSNSLARCIAADPRCGKSPTVWYFEAAYTTKFDRQKQPQDDELIITCDEQDFGVPLIYDFNKDPVLNSAGDPPAEPLTAEDSTDIITVEANVTGKPSWYYTHKRAVNSDGFVIDGLSVAARHARLNKRSISWWKYRGSYAFRVVKVTLEIRRADMPDFRYRWLDQGFRRKPTAAEVSAGTYAATDRVLMKELSGDDATDPILLDGSGGRLNNPSPSNAYFNETIYHPELTFGGVIPGCV